MKGIFILVQAKEAAPAAGRLRDVLAQRYGGPSLFLDIDSNWVSR